MKCRNCGIETKNRIFCSRKCNGLWHSSDNNVAKRLDVRGKISFARRFPDKVSEEKASKRIEKQLSMAERSLKRTIERNQYAKAKEAEGALKRALSALKNFPLRRIERRNSTESNIRRSNTLKGRVITHVHRAKISTALKGRKFSKEHRDNISISHRGIQRGEKNPRYGKPGLLGEKNPHYGKPASHGKGSYFIRSNGEKIWLRSSYEVRVATILDDRDIPFDYEPQAFPLRGTGTTYRPDFYLSDQKIWLEVKGYMSDLARKKIELFREQYPEEKLIILYGEDIKRLEEVQPFVGGSVE